MEPFIDVVFLSSINLGKMCIQVYDLAAGSCIKSFRGVCVTPNTLCTVGNNDYIICGQKDKPLLQAWALNVDDSLQMRFHVPGKVNVMTVSQNTDKLCAVGIEEKIFIYHLTTGCQFALLSQHYQDVSCLKFTSCGNYLASAAEDGFVYLWSRFSLLESLHKVNRPQIEPHFILGQHSDKVTGLTICGTGLRGILISCSIDYSAKVFDLVTGHLRHNIATTYGLTAVEINAIGSQVFFASDKGRIWGMNLLPHSGVQNLELEGEGTLCHKSSIQHLSLSTKGDLLVTGGTDGEVKVWSIVIPERKGVFGLPLFALQKTLLVGRGTITNVMITKLELEVFSASFLPVNTMLSPFNNDTDILDANVLHIAPATEEELYTPSELRFLAAELMEKGKRNKRKTEKIVNVVEVKNQEVNEDLQKYIQRLKNNNEEFYKFCIRHVLGED